MPSGISQAFIIGHDDQHASSVLRPTGSGATSFIRRCWYPGRGCGESSACSDMREAFRAAPLVDMLPEDCEMPVYVVSGSRIKHGLKKNGILETLFFRDEDWFKCCGDTTLTCEKVEAYGNTRLHQDYDGKCGGHPCIGDRKRCLVVDKMVDDDYRGGEGTSPST